jgi:hypothetical protein
MNPSQATTSPIVWALGEQPRFHAGDRVRILTRSPIGHYRVPLYLRGKTGTVETVIEPAAVRKGLLSPTELAEKMKEVEARFAAENSDAKP